MLIVSTNVGGIKEVLPGYMARLSDPQAEPFIEALSNCIKNDILRPGGQIDAWKMHNDICRMYNWHDVAERTEQVYHALPPVATRDVKNTFFCCNK